MHTNSRNSDKAKLITGTLLSAALLLGGCSNTNGDSNKGGEEQVSKPSNTFVSIDNYNGEGYELPNGKKTDKIAEANRDQITKATKKFFLDTYKTEVNVHNIVGNKDGASVFVESVGEPHFHTFAIVPIDSQEKIMTDGIWTQEGQVEAAIKSGLYAMIYEDQLKELDSYLEEFTSKQPVTGMEKEAIQNVRSTGFTTPYYYISVLDEGFDALYENYLENPKTTKEEWQQTAQSLEINPKGYRVTIQLFMKEKDQKPDQKILDQISTDLENMDTLSPGYYSVYLNDNTIDAKSADGTKESTIKRANPNYIKKQ